MKPLGQRSLKRCVITSYSIHYTKLYDFTSSYLNQIASSHHRATVLSFKGMAFNLAYGAIGLGFAQLMQTLRSSNRASSPGITETVLENLSFKEAVSWFPWYSILGIIGVSVLCKHLLRNTDLKSALEDKP